MISVQNRHTVDRAGLIISSCGVHDVIRADNQRDIGPLEFVIDLIHLIKLIVGDVGFGQQDVHVARHTARHGVNRVFHFDSVFGQLGRHLAHRMLCLGHRQPIARHDDHELRVLHQDGRIFGLERLHGFARRAGPSSGCRLHLSEGSEQDVRNRAIHRFAHQDSQQGTGGADERAADQHRDVVDCVSIGRDGQSREGVEQRDHDGHVGASDGEHHQDAEDERDREENAKEHRVGLPKLI